MDTLRGPPNAPANAPDESPAERLERLRERVKQNAAAVAILGEWPPYVKIDSLIERVPSPDGGVAPGFDAGIACALGLIPGDRQRLAAHLHANYSKESVERIRREQAAPNADTETTWWLAACSLCDEGEADAHAFLAQVDAFKQLAAEPAARLAAAMREFGNMTSRFTLVDGMPYGTEDGCMQGAYIAGHPFASMYAENYGVYFIGTYEESLGLEDFAWSEEKDEKGRAKSGPVFGSRQFVKCANEDEWKRALAIVQQRLPEPAPLQEKA